MAKVEASADLRFSSALRKADVLAGTPLEEALESGRFIEIDGPDDLLLSRPGPAGKAAEVQAGCRHSRSSSMKARSLAGTWRRFR